MDPKDLQATLTFTVPDGVKPVAASTGPSRRIRHEGTFERRRVTIRDARPRRSELKLDSHGFTLVDHPTAVVDFHDEDELARRYDPEIEALLGSISGVTRVVVFDRTLRSGDVAEQEARLLREPVNVAHNDYTLRSGPSRMRLAMGDEADALLERRFAIIQVWRPTGEPIARDPLALCDARTIRPADLIPVERRHPNRIGEIYNLAYHGEQRWWWVPTMRRDEALVFKTYDSAAAGVARFTPHASFADSGVAADAPPRRSIEVRALAFF